MILCIVSRLLKVTAVPLVITTTKKKIRATLAFSYIFF